MRSLQFHLLFVALASPACLDDQLDPQDGFLLGSTPGEHADDNGRLLDAGAAEASEPGAFVGGRGIELADVAVFIALERDFEDFLRWPRVSIGTGEHAGQSGAKTVFINALPEAGDEEFRVGTLIVKTVEVSAAMSSWQVHAMAKRGGGFNAKGAYEWEFFDLQLDDQADVTMAWRGEEPPAGENYRTTIVAADGSETVVEANCNDCHIGAYNDAVLTTLLDLDAF